MLKQILVMISFIGFFQCSLAHAKELACHLFLGPSLEGQSKLSPTAGLIAYLNYLVEQQIVNLESLRHLSEELKTHGKIITNPVPNLVTPQGMQFTQSVYQIHYENFEQYLQQTDLNHEEVLKWTLAILDETQGVQLQKDTVGTKTSHPLTGMRLHRVEKGSFVMNKLGRKVLVELTHDFEVMATPVTQWMWVEEMKENPSHFKEKDSGRIQPDHPVENITWYSAAMFANHMSRKYGLKEVYDFSGCTFQPGTKAEDGTLDVVGEVKINGTNIYETEGYRLPTEAEQEYVLSDRGRSKTNYFTDITPLNYIEYAWYMMNSDKQTHAVAEKPPLMMGDRDFYDLYGNVFEWGNDRLRNQSDKVPEGIDPVGAGYGHERVIRGGSWSVSYLTSTASYRGSWPSSSKANSIGFRLVRTVK